MSEYDEEYDDTPVAPAPVNVVQWSWTPTTMLWVGGGLLAIGFTVYFLISYTSAKAVASAGAGDSSE